MQTKLQSMVEITVSTAIGMVVALVSQLVLFPAFGTHCTIQTDLWLTVWFTAISLSLIRSYVVRRIFNKKEKTLSASMEFPTLFNMEFGELPSPARPAPPMPACKPPRLADMIVNAQIPPRKEPSKPRRRKKSFVAEDKRVNNTDRRRTKEMEIS